MMINLSPIIVFAFIRLDTLKQTIEALKKNDLASESDLFIFIDGARNQADINLITKVYEYCSTIDGFKSVRIKKSEQNFGLDESEVAGISEIIERFGKVIVLEDDIVTTPNFLQYMNQALNYYEKQQKIFSIAAYGLTIDKPKKYSGDVYLYDRNCSWGWGTWLDRWKTVDWNLSDWDTFSLDRKSIKAFNRGGSDMFRMLKKAKEGGNMWDIKFSYAQFKQNKFTVFPFLSKSQNIGFKNELSTHTKEKFMRFKTNEDTELSKKFAFISDFELNEKIHKQVYWFHSFWYRLYAFIRRKINI